MCPDGTGAVGCGPQEEFRACSDISIGKFLAIYLMIFLEFSIELWILSLSISFQVNLMLLHRFVQSVQEQNQQNKHLALQMAPREHRQRIPKHSKCRSTIHHRAIWERLLSFCRHCWWFYACYLPFICIIIMEVASSILCIGISKRIINHHRQCPAASPFQWSSQIIRHQHSIHPYHRHVQNDCHKHLAM